jgi:uroporphyrinogen decarboxylase
MFDSWAGYLSPQDYDTFALPYQRRVFQQVKQTHPDTPLILLVSGSAGVLERMAQSGADIVTVDWTVDMADARTRLGKHVKVQGNLDPGVLYGSQEFIRDRIYDTVRKAGNWGHILNLGHGVHPDTPEENVAFFFETAKQLSAAALVS